MAGGGGGGGVLIFPRSASSLGVFLGGGSTKTPPGRGPPPAPFRWEALPYWISESDGVARGVKSLVELFVSTSLPSAATLRRTLRP